MTTALIKRDGGTRKRFPHHTAPSLAWEQAFAPWRNFYMARLGAVFVFPSLPQKQPPAFPGKCAIIDPMLQVVDAPAEI